MSFFTDKLSGWKNVTKDDIADKDKPGTPDWIINLQYKLTKPFQDITDDKNTILEKIKKIIEDLFTDGWNAFKDFLSFIWGGVEDLVKWIWGEIKVPVEIAAVIGSVILAFVLYEGYKHADQFKPIVLL